MVSRARGWVKICGITVPGDIDGAFEAGADAIGINLWPGSPRAVTLETARRLVDHARGRLQVVLVSMDAGEGDLRAWLRDLCPDYLQLHGDEPDGLVQTLLPHAFKAVGVASALDVERAIHAPGDFVLVDFHSPMQRGGTGRQAPSELAAQVCRQRRAVLAGGLRPENVRERILHVRPWGVDVASGVETSPGRKDRERMLAFVCEAREAWSAVGVTNHV